MLVCPINFSKTELHRKNILRFVTVLTIIRKVFQKSVRPTSKFDKIVYRIFFLFYLNLD